MTKISSKLYLGLATIALALFYSVSASATLLYDNGSDTTNIGGYCSACGPVDSYTMFDDFTLSSGQSDLTLQWDASFFNVLPSADPTRSVRIGIWSNANDNQIWSQLFTFADLNLLSVNATSGSHANLTMEAMLSGVNLGAGTYWLSMSGDDMHFSTTVTPTGAFQVSQSQLGTGYVPDHSIGMTFRIHGVANVPEPGSIALLALGLAGLGFTRRKKNA